MSEANKALVRRVIEELFTKHNVALMSWFSLKWRSDVLR